MLICISFYGPDKPSMLIWICVFVFARFKELACTCLMLNKAKSDRERTAKKEGNQRSFLPVVTVVGEPALSCQTPMSTFFPFVHQKRLI